MTVGEFIDLLKQYSPSATFEICDLVEQKSKFCGDYAVGDEPQEVNYHPGTIKHIIFEDCEIVAIRIQK